MACSYENHGVFNISKSRIKVFNFEHEGRKVPYTCTQCAEAWCMSACPVDAIRVDAATGAKVVHADACVGCKVCTIACPFGTINTWPTRAGAEMRPVRRRSRLRHGLSHRCHHLRRCRMGPGSTRCASGAGKTNHSTARQRLRRLTWGIGHEKSCALILSKGTCKSEPLNMEWAQQYLGQRGLATKYFVEEVEPQGRSPGAGQTN